MLDTLVNGVSSDYESLGFHSEDEFHDAYTHFLDELGTHGPYCECFVHQKYKHDRGCSCRQCMAGNGGYNDDVFDRRAVLLPEGISPYRDCGWFIASQGNSATLLNP